jgi:hypothetical protein
MKTPPIVTPEEWEAARQQLLVKEKQVTRARDALAAERRRMPWLAVEKEYAFGGPEGKASLLDLFEAAVSSSSTALSSSPACTDGPATRVLAVPWWPIRSPTSRT